MFLIYYFLFLLTTLVNGEVSDSSFLKKEALDAVCTIGHICKSKMIDLPSSIKRVISEQADLSFFEKAIADSRNLLKSSLELERILNVPALEKVFDRYENILNENEQTRSFCLNHASINSAIIVYECVENSTIGNATIENLVTGTMVVGLSQLNTTTVCGNLTVSCNGDFSVSTGKTYLGDHLRVNDSVTIANGLTIDSGGATVNGSTLFNDLATFNNGFLVQTGGASSTHDISAATLYTTADLGGVSGSIGITSTKAFATGAQFFTIQGSSAIANSGFIKIYIDTTPYWIPIFASN